MSERKRKLPSQQEPRENKYPKTASDPPEVDVTLLKNEDLPKTSVRLDDRPQPIDFLLLTVKDDEFLACLSYMKPNFSRFYNDDLGFVYLGDMGKARVALMKCNMGSTGPGGSSGVSREAVKFLRPKAVFCVGFCGGLNTNKIKLGDVVVSQTLITYALSKVTPDGIISRGHSVPLKKLLGNVIRDVKAGWKAPLKYPIKSEIEIHRGTLLSGPEVVDSDERRNDLLKRFPDGIAIEMEGEGVFAAAQDLDVEWIIIKGVSDYADGKKSATNSWRPFASLMAASLTAHILSDPNVFQRWPHYGSENTTTPSFSVVQPSGTSSSTSCPPATPSTCNPQPRDRDLIKDGAPEEVDLEKLSRKLGDSWERVARRLDFNIAEIAAFDTENRQYAEKAFKMLLQWKQKLSLNATYRVLYNALCHELVNRKDLAQDFCCL